MQGKVRIHAIVVGNPVSLKEIDHVEIIGYCCQWLVVDILLTLDTIGANATNDLVVPVVSIHINSKKFLVGHTSAKDFRVDVARRIPRKSRPHKEDEAPILR
jgi:hypothetical protein